MEDKTMDIIDKSLDILISSLILIEHISKQSKEEILKMIIEEGGKTNNLLEKLRK